MATYSPTYSLDLEASSSQYAYASDTTSLSITGALTIEAWVKFESAPASGNSYMIAGKWNSGSNARSWLFTSQNDFEVAGSALVFRVDKTGDNTGSVCIGSVSFTPTTGQWYHLAAVYTTASSGTIALYVDSVLQTTTYGTRNATAIYDGNANTDIGSRNGGASTFLDGKICQVRLWNTDRSASIASTYTTIIDSASGLAASWQLNNDYQDGSGNRNNLTSSGSPVFSADVPTLTAYTLSDSIDLESSSSQYSSITDAQQTGLDFTTAMSLEGWFKFESEPGTDANFALITKFENATANRSYLFSYRDTSGVKSLQLQLSTLGTTVNSDVGVSWDASTDVWYHLAVTYAGGATLEVKFYVDGSQQGTTQVTTVASIFNGTAAFLIGAATPASPSAFFDGKIFMVRTWSSVRTSSDFSTNQCDFLAAGTSNLSAQWTFSSSYRDFSGNSNSLTATNAPVFSSDIPSVCSSAGPANLKSLDTNLKANIKSYNTNVLANIKSINTNA